MNTNKIIYEGKAKILHESDDPLQAVQFFKDDASAFDGAKKGAISDKGELNNTISSLIFELLESKGIKTHFIKKISKKEMLVRKVDIIPVEVVVRNVVAGSLAKRMGIEEGTRLKETIVELYYKNDELHDPMINEYHVRVFGLGTDLETKFCQETALKINSILVDFFDKIDLILVDFKLEFGRFGSEIILADEISPDGCRLWDKSSGEKMDKDRFRQDLGKVEEAYHEVCKRVLGALDH